MQKSVFSERADCLCKMIAEQCAPVMFGIKPSNLLIIDPVYEPVLMSIVAGTGLKVRCFYFGSGRHVWFMYSEKMLIQYLETPEISEFMRQFGYKPDMPLGQVLLHTSNDFAGIKRKSSHFHMKWESFWVILFAMSAGLLKTGERIIFAPVTGKSMQIKKRHCRHFPDMPA